MGAIRNIRKQNIMSVCVLTLTMVVGVFLAGCDDSEQETLSQETSRDVVTSAPVIEIDTSILDTNANTSDEEMPEEIVYDDGIIPGSIEEILFDTAWEYADFSEINTGTARLYRAGDNRNGMVVGINAGHGTEGGTSVKTYCHPDMSAKVTGGTTAAGSVKAVAVSSGMAFRDGTPEAKVTLREAQLLRDLLLQRGYDVLMLRDDDDVQLDNVARTIICNNMADCHIAIHWDGDNLSYDKGCFYISTPNRIKDMEPVKDTYMRSEELGELLIEGLKSQEVKISGSGSMAIDLTQTSFSTVPSVDIELGNAASEHDDATLMKLAEGMAAGIEKFLTQSELTENN